jgi:hypothetical protein
LINEAAFLVHRNRGVACGFPIYEVRDTGDR